uniref:HTH CENPB-type domain-containing protein n=1 Tax=Timema genevievae TaxID=629358 RepID=A0A7R9K150_TIMGE|nr:unnamed protein product [Timema genevievae]
MMGRLGLESRFAIQIALVVLSSTAEDGEIEVRISVGQCEESTVYFNHCKVSIVSSIRCKVFSLSSNQCKVSVVSSNQYKVSAVSSSQCEESAVYFNQCKVPIVSSSQCKVFVVSSNQCKVSIVSSSQCKVFAVSSNQCRVPAVSYNQYKVSAVSSNQYQVSAVSSNQYKCKVFVVSSNQCKVSIVSSSQCKVFVVSSNQCKVSIVSSNQCKVSVVSSNQCKVSAVSSNQYKVSAVSSNQCKVSIVSSNHCKVSIVSSIRLSAVSSNQCKVSIVSSNQCKVFSLSSNQCKVSIVSSNQYKVSVVSSNQYKVSAVSSNHCKVSIVCSETASQENRCNVRALALKFGVGKSQVSEILKNRDTILKLSSESGCSLKKFGMSLKVDDKVFRWFRSALANGVSVSGPLLKAKAKDVAGQLGYYNFKASNGWLHRFRLRHGITCKAVLGSDQTVMDDLCPLQTMAQSIMVRRRPSGSSLRCRKGNSLSTYAAAEKYKIPRRTLRNHLKSGSLKKSLGREEQEADLKLQCDWYPRPLTKKIRCLSTPQNRRLQDYFRRLQIPRNRTPGKKSLDSSGSTSAANVQLDQTPVTHPGRRYNRMVQPPEQNVGSRDFLQMDLPPSQDLEDISHSLGEWRDIVLDLFFVCSAKSPLNSRSCSFSPSSPHLALLLLKSLLPSPCALAPPVPPPLTSRSCFLSPSSPHLALFLLQFLILPLLSYSPSFSRLTILLLQSSPFALLLQFFLSAQDQDLDLGPGKAIRAYYGTLGTPSLLRERNVKRSKQVSDPNPGPSSSQTCVVSESTELIVVKEEPMSFDIDDMSNYNMTFVDVNQHESILAETSETPGTSRAESLFDERMSQQCLVSPSGQELETNGRQLQSAQLAEYALDPNSLTSSSQNISSKRKKSEGNGKRGYLTSCETSKTETDIRLHMVKLEVEQMREEHVTKMANLQRKMDIQLDQMTKEHESNMTNLQRKMNIQLDQMKKEHELNMANLQTKMDIQHEAKMKEHEIKMIELTGKTDQIRLKNEEIKKKMELDGTISELTVRKLREKINAIIMKREQVSQVHEVTVQELKQKLNNSYLENQILKMKQDALEK